MTNPIHQEFLDNDFRSNRPPECGVPMNPEITKQKHELLLPPDLIKGKSILDIGSFIGQTGDWCLNNGAASYTGVEISKQFAETSRELLSTFYSDQTWAIYNGSLENFFETNSGHYDIVFCWGVLFGNIDHMWLMRELAQRADHVIVESRHPKAMWKGYEKIIPNPMWESLEYEIPYQEWQDGTMTMLAAVNGSVKCTAANSSIAALKLMMEVEGFSASLGVYEELKKRFPHNFGMFRDPNKIGRFVVEFYKDSEAKKHYLTNEIFEDNAKWDATYVDWMKK